jgi:hypothetical protein
MHPNQYTLTPKDIYRYAVTVLQPHLKTEIYSACQLG